MKLFVVLALLGVCTGRICTEIKAAAAHSLRETFVDPYITPILNICDALGTPSEFFGEDCSALFNEGVCFTNIMQDKYGPKEYDADGCPIKKELTYKKLADIATTEVKKMGNVVCNHGFKCINHLRNQLNECVDQNDKFYDNVWEQIKTLLRLHINTPAKYNAYWKQAKDMLSCEFEDDSYVMCMFEKARMEFNTLEDLITFVEKDVKSFIDNIEKTDGADELKNDLLKGFHIFMEKGTNFCGKHKKCVCKSAHYFSKLFTATHDDDTCANTNKYCGDCQDNAEEFLDDKHSVKIPCCTRNAIRDLTDAFQFVDTNHGDFITNIKDQVIDRLTEEVDKCDSNQAYIDYMAAIEGEATCLKDTTDKLGKLSNCSSKKECTLMDDTTSK